MLANHGKLVARPGFKGILVPMMKALVETMSEINSVCLKTTEEEFECMGGTPDLTRATRELLDNL